MRAVRRRRRLRRKRLRRLRRNATWVTEARLVPTVQESLDHLS